MRKIQPRERITLGDKQLWGSNPPGDESRGTFHHGRNDPATNLNNAVSSLSLLNLLSITKKNVIYLTTLSALGLTLFYQQRKIIPDFVLIIFFLTFIVNVTFAFVSMADYLFSSHPCLPFFIEMKVY